MSESSGAGYLDRLLTSGPGAIQVEGNGVALEAPIDKINVVGSNVAVTYLPPGGGELYGTAVVELGAITALSLSDLPVGTANSVLTSDGVSDAFSPNPVVNSITGTTNIKAGATGHRSSLTGNNLLFGPGASTINAPIGTDSAISIIIGSSTYFSCSLAGGISANGRQIHGGASPTSANDFATKAYVDAVAAGLKTLASVNVVSDSNLTTLSGLSTTIDSFALNTDGMRVLLTAQPGGTSNGIYVVHSGAWTRSTDMASGMNASGDFTFVTNGTNYVNTGWTCISPVGSDVVGTNSLDFTKSSSAGQIVAGTCLTKTGNTINVVAATTSNAGSMSAAQCTKLDAIAGTAGQLAMFDAVGLSDSAISDNGTTVTVTRNLSVYGVSGNTGLFLIDAGAGVYSNWFLSSNSHTVGPSTRGALVFFNASDTSSPRLWIGDDGLIGFGGITDPTAGVDTNTLRVRTGAGAGFVARSDSAGNVTWTDPSLITSKTGTHRAQMFHTQLARVLSSTPLVIAFPESVWKGDTVDPDSATWYTMVTITIRSQWMDAVSNTMRERVQKQLIYKLRVGTTWRSESVV